MSRVLIQQCTQCKAYTLQTEMCPECGGKPNANRPPKFSPEDPYGDYRRRLKAIDAAEKDAKRAA